MINRKKFNKLLEDCMEELYQNSTPKASFKQLVNHAKENMIKNEYGQLVIPYDKHFIDSDTYTKITDKYKNKYSLNKTEQSAFNMAIHLGPSPTTKK